LESGEELVLESDYAQWVEKAMTEALARPIGTLDVADMPRETEK
jgi:hypothetical protein